MKADYQKTSDMHSMLVNSNNWLIIRLDEEGLHCHVKDVDDFGLIALFLSDYDELYKSTVESVNRIKKSK